MALYRCAACGSSHVVSDTQSGGYNYKKGLLGSILFGSGGATAGINGKTQTVYKCSACGLTLTYCMPTEILVKVEQGLIDPHFSRIEWEGLKKSYANLEESALEQKIKEDEGRKKKAIEKINFISEDELIQAAKDITAFWNKFGYMDSSAAVYDFKHKNLPSADEYLFVCERVRTFVNHLPQHISHLYDIDDNIPQSAPEYEQLFDVIVIPKLLYFLMSLDYYEETGKAMPLTNQISETFFHQNLHLKDLALRIGVLYDGRLFGSGGTALILPICDKSYDPDKFVFSSGKARDMFRGFVLNEEFLSSWEYFVPFNWYSYERYGRSEYIYPQLITEGITVQINQPVF